MKGLRGTVQIDLLVLTGLANGDNVRDSRGLMAGSRKPAIVWLMTCPVLLGANAHRRELMAFSETVGKVRGK
jgi:hypothetical protein